MFISGTDHTSDELSCLLADVGQVEVEIEVHVAQFARNVEDAHHLDLVVLVPTCHCEVAQWYCGERMVAEQVDVGVERITIERHSAALLQFKVTEDDVVEIHAVSSTLYVVVSEHGKRSFVIVVAGDGADAVGGHIRIVLRCVVHTELDFTVRVDDHIEIDEYVARIFRLVFLVVGKEVIIVVHLFSNAVAAWQVEIILFYGRLKERSIAVGDERGTGERVGRCRIVSEDAASCRTDVGGDVERMAVTTGQMQVAVSEDSAVELIGVELVFFIAA